MYTIKKTFEVSAAHKLKLNYPSPCQELHGHNWKITVFCRSEQLDENGMVIDFSKIKKLIVEKIDHKNLNDVLDFNSTAENLAKWVVDTIPFCYKATVEEAVGSEATYEKI
jgi:6-pyruvoyltetrahydropterin/6-carboxytetrahydropterin synthase